jgi:hypothetical protein
MTLSTVGLVLVGCVVVMTGLNWIAHSREVGSQSGPAGSTAAEYSNRADEQ